MSPNARDRARARRRYERRQAALADRTVQRRRAQQVVGAVVAVVLVAGGAVGLTRALGSSTPESGPTAAESPSRATGTGTDTGPNPCRPPGPAPASPSTYASAPPASLAGGRVSGATIATTCGDLEVELFGDKAPQTVSSFVFLARQRYFDSTPCHRLTTEGIYVLQCGDPTGAGNGGPGYEFGVENAPADGRYPAGTLAMARGESPTSNGSQFFLTYEDTTLPTSTGGYTIFGKVTSGLSVLRAVAAGGVADGRSDGAPARAVSISSVTVTQ